MSTRPEVLFPLFSSLESLPGIGAKTAALLTQSGIERPRDLMLTLPHAVVDRRPVASLAHAVFPAVITVAVTIDGHVPARRKGGPAKVLASDSDGATLELTFFHARGDYLDKAFPIGARRLVSGKAELFDGVAQMVHPDYMVPLDQAQAVPTFEPIYPLTQGVSQKVMARAANGVLERLPALDEWIDAGQKQRENWPDWGDALRSAHHPQSAADTAPVSPARMRLAYDEFFAHQMTLALARRNGRRLKGRVTRGTGVLQKQVMDTLPYDMTGAQKRAVAEITADMAGDARMNRLLQGDVGAGKTLVALMSMLAAAEAGGQAVMMAPTEILARQHMESLQPLIAQCGVRIELLTGRDKGTVRAKKLADLADGTIDILVGTHAVFQKDVEFHDLRMVVIDEQHRFGVAQRMELGRKGQAVDVLVMTATPIPRSLALSQYGDMDLSVLDEKPPGRTPVRTALMPTARMPEVVDHLKRAIAEGRQAYWVCPLVEESEKVDLASAEERFATLRAALGDGNVGLVHGQMPPAEKDAAMADFVAGRTRILVATTVIEVGVNVPNASIMVIERAEIFGLAQLHQLRGRVGRGSAQSTCLMLYQAPLSQSGERRLAILRETEDGFRIAEEDLAIRGAGDVIGTAQSGLPRFRIANLETQAGLMAIAQSDARTLLAMDPTLDSPRGRAARNLLWLMGQDQAIRLMDVG